jgi:hypothetical protein
MRRAGAAVLLTAVVGVVAFVAPGWSAAPPTPTEKRLLAEVATLQVKVGKLQTDDKSLTKDVTALKKAASDISGAALASLLFSACDAALTADALQGTWQTLDQVTAALQNGTVYFGAQTPVDDTFFQEGTNACAALRITRSQALPPNAGNIAALLLLLHP